MTAVVKRVEKAVEPPVDQEPMALGQMVREARRRKGWTLEEAGRRAGIGRSTLSRIENNMSKPGFDVVRRLMQALEIEKPQLFLKSVKSDISGRRDVTRKGAGEAKSTPSYEHELLCTELSNKGMLPYFSRIKARDISAFDDWIRHRGEEFMLVVSGSVELHTEFYRPLAMETGDSVYYDSAMGHCCVSTSKEDVRVLWVSMER